MTVPDLFGRLYLPVLAAIAVIGVVIIFIVGLIHLWPYALGGGVVLFVGLVIPIIFGMADT
jgi:ABC-type transport system involved in cytochrome bd biosynthesis fused ATPase/permease subunit